MAARNGTGFGGKAPFRLPALRSAVPGMGWPGLPQLRGASLLGIHYQLAASERMPAQEVRNGQFRQIGALVDHCLSHVPFWSERLRPLGRRIGQQVTEDAWRSFPVLRRRELQKSGEALLARIDPPGHGQRVPFETSGSTGAPVKGIHSTLALTLWDSIVLRDHLWHSRDLGARFAAIRRVKPERAGPQGRALAGWSTSLAATFANGPAFLFDFDRSASDQAAWLHEIDPHYLHTQPSILRAIVHESTRLGGKPRALRSISTFGEQLPAETRTLVREAWGLPIEDIYSTVEVGFIALQCPAFEHYHVQSEMNLVEVLDADGRPCEPGHVGEVVVTPLHNFAMPLLRYAIGDYAEVGPPCPCGRNLPVLARIIGRTRNVVRRADGSVQRPALDDLFKAVATNIVQYQVVETSRRVLEIRVVTDAEIAPADVSAIQANVAKVFGPGFDAGVARVASIPRGEGGKYEDFISLPEAARQAS